MFFYYEKGFDGTWRAVKSEERPKKRGADGVKKTFSEPVRLPAAIEDSPLSELEQIYPAPEVSHA